MRPSILLLLVPISAWGNPMVDMMLRPTVEVFVNENDPELSKRNRGSGTVFKVTELGTFILTNYHVVGDKEDLTVRFYDEKNIKYEATVYSIEPILDIAVIFTEHQYVSQAELGRPEDVQLFQESICVGASDGLPSAPSRGMITQLDYIEGAQLLYRSDCNITFGNSGGGMYVEVNGVWKLVGISTLVRAQNVLAILVPVSFLGFMVRIDDVLKHLEEHSLFP